MAGDRATPAGGSARGRRAHPGHLPRRGAAGAGPGGQAPRAPAPEIGFVPVSLTAPGRTDRLLGVLPESFRAFSWHSYALRPPAGAMALARSAGGPQAFRCGASSWGIQFHAEASASSVETWTAELASDPDAVRAGLDPARLRDSTRRWIGPWNRLGLTLCRRFLEIAAAAPGGDEQQGRTGLPGPAGGYVEPVPAATAFPLLGAVPAGEPHTAFSVWAPAARHVDVVSGGDRHPLSLTDQGLFTGRAPLAPGADYELSLDGGEGLPDPCSRWQPEGLRGPSRVLKLPPRSVTDFTPPLLEDLVIYELHVGTFSAAGTFAGVIPRLGELRQLGVTALELMPVATFPGRHGWGYDGVYLSAPQQPYGGPEGLLRLVDAAHEAGLAVILDVVYNHLGAGSDRVAAFGPYFTDRYDTFWGQAIDYAQRPVREWAIQNAELWVRDYGIDGLRLDATHAVFDDSQPHILRELTDRVRAINPRALIISEMEIGDLRPIREWGHDAQWEDALHHAAHVLLTGEREGYYSGYGRMADLAREISRTDGPRFVVCAQNHDQVGNRALGDRLRGRDLRLAAFCAILSPGTPMLFQGEEYDESHPFQYFTDHIDPEIAQMTRDGRRREFSEFSDFSAEEIPDPQDPQTFLRSKLDPSDGDPEHLEYYRELLSLRRELRDAPAEVLEVDEERRLLRVRRGPVELVANFSEAEQAGVAPRSGKILR